MEKQLKIRSLLIGIFFFLLFFGVIARLYWIQVVEASDLRAKAKDVWTKEEILRPVRGAILDRNGKSLAEETPAYTVALNPRVLHDRAIEREAAHGLAEILSLSESAEEKAALEEKIFKLTKKTKPDSDQLAIEVEVRNEGLRIDAEKKKQVDELIAKLQNDLKARKDASYKVVGIYTKPTQKRHYPNGRLASQVLGAVDREGKPILGLETTLDNLLAGTWGKLVHEKDLKGVEIPDSPASLTPAVNGKDVRLTIDQTIQYYTESALRKAYQQWKPKSMMAIAVDPKTMEILAMANMPDYDPNKFWEADKSGADYRNRVVSDQYEPGSTLKLVTLAAAIEEGLWKPDALYVSGSIAPKGMKPIHDHNWSGWGTISFMQGLVRSSNVLFVKLGYEALGKEKFTDYLKKFGFGEKTGIDLAGEVAGQINFRWPSDYARATYGQSVTVTTLQQVAAYAAIANGGKLMKPYIVKDVLDPETGKVLKSNGPREIRRVVTEETARQTVLALEQVVAHKDGTGKLAAIDGYRVAGKTGTANVVSEGGSGYADREWLVSFVGFAPVEDPKILVAIIADRPQLGGNYHLGGQVTLPVFREIMANTLTYMGVPSSSSVEKTESSEKVVNIPDVDGKPVKEAQEAVASAGLQVEILGSGSTITGQLPKAGSEVLANHKVFLIAGQSGDAEIPDLTGLSLRDAMEVASLLGIACRSDGEGFVVKQSVAEENGRRVLHLEFKPFEDSPVPSAAEKSASPGGSASDQSVSGEEPAPKEEADKQPSNEQQAAKKPSG